MSDQERRTKQFVVLGAVGLVALGGVAALMAVASSTNTPPIGQSANNTVSETLISERSSGATPEMDWVVQSRDRLKAVEAQMKQLQTDKASIKSEYQRQLNAVSKGYEDMIGTQVKQIDKMQKQIEQLKNKADNLQLPNVKDPNAQPNSPLGIDTGKRSATPTDTYQRYSETAQDQTSGEFVSNNSGTHERARAVSTTPKPKRNKTFSTRFSLKTQRDTRKGNLKTYALGSYLPAGSYVPAIVISGVDASVGVASQSSPKPVTLRITGSATTAGFGTTKGAKIDLKGCLVLGAATGDLSSERVYVRLTIMTCQNSDGSVFETKVAGHMVSSGKAGLRGDVVSREGPAVRGAAIAGVLEGLATGASAASGGVLSGLTNDTGGDPDVSSIIKSAGTSAAAGGVSNAASTLADYYINRAEQYQPVVSMYAGSKVELVFMEGVHLE